MSSTVSSVSGLGLGLGVPVKHDHGAQAPRPQSFDAGFTTNTPLLGVEVGGLVFARGKGTGRLYAEGYIEEKGQQTFRRFCLDLKSSQPKHSGARCKCKVTGIVGKTLYVEIIDSGN